MLNRIKLFLSRGLLVIVMLAIAALFFRHQSSAGFMLGMIVVLGLVIWILSTHRNTRSKKDA